LSATRFAIFITLVGWVAFVATTLSKAFFGETFSVRYAADAIVYLVVVTLLTASALAYLVARLGFAHRARRHERVPRSTIDSFFSARSPGLTVIVPSYREDAAVIRQTLLSAALQEYPSLNVVLLVDDPPNPDDPHELALLEAARALPGEIEELLRAPRERFERALEDFADGELARGEVTVEGMRALAAHYVEASSALTAIAADFDEADASEKFVRHEVIGGLAGDLTTVAGALRRAADEGATLTPPRMVQLYERLVWTFRADVSSFERKRYLSLSHEANKAMNLNSYIGLMGGRYVARETLAGTVLLPAAGEDWDLDVPEPEYVLTLDADSVLLPEYCLRLVHLMEQPEFERVAVAQTPYSAFPGAATRLERIAGATTDIQHILHQGMTHFGATFWVGANAVLRKRALDEIGETEHVGGYPIRRFIQDRTVIEDTESSVDLGLRGWSLYNYPERLSYSATPPDFGSLCIQRQRWANGGLLILEKFRRYAAAARARRGLIGARGELFLRLNYLASIAWASVGLVVLLVYPFNGALLSPIVLATALPYFVAMTGDLKRCGYKRTDVFRIYGFNLILLAVNLSGVLKSIAQAIGGQKIAFARTPKVRNRTTAAISFVVFPYLIILFALFTIWRDLVERQYTHAAYAAVNALLCGYAVVAFIGIRHSLVDVWSNVLQRVWRPVEATDAGDVKELDWVTVLYDGAQTGVGAKALPSAAALRSTDSVLAAAAGSAPMDAMHDRVAVLEPAGREAPTESDDVAAVVTRCLRELDGRGRMVVLLDGGVAEVVVEPGIER
jgi:cellulose synthase/poly-beta-1,6-N-acetylglucosamine synthase-like glycosyltransferase